MQTKVRLLIAAVAWCFCATPVFAQSAQEDAPLSAIGWLSDTVREPPPSPDVSPDGSNQTASSASPSAITTSRLGRPNNDAIGLLSSAQTGLPADFWGQSGTQTLVKLISEQRVDLIFPLNELMQQILLAELTPPADSVGSSRLFLARVDWFLRLGALDQASALLGAADTDTPEIFRRWFDIGLLTDASSPACTKMLSTPDIAPTYLARVFCLARSGDWEAANVTLNTGHLLGVISEPERRLLARFLDPELFEGQPYLPIPDRITPLQFQMHNAIGEPLALGSLPNAFVFAALSENEGWKARITAAERLARAGGIPQARLFDIYSERKAAASGGVWDRVGAMSALETAIESGDLKSIAFHLEETLRVMRRAGLEVVFAQHFGEELFRLGLPDGSALTAARLALLTSAYETVPTHTAYPTNAPRLWDAVARGQTLGVEGATALEAAIISGLNATEPPTIFADLLASNRTGEALLRAIALMEDGVRSDPAAIEDTIALLQQVNMVDFARRTALHVLLLAPT